MRLRPGLGHRDSDPAVIVQEIEDVGELRSPIALDRGQNAVMPYLEEAAGAGEAGYRKQREERKMRGATTRRDRPSGAAMPRDLHHRRGPRSSVSVALRQLLTLIITTTIRARLSAH